MYETQYANVAETFAEIDEDRDGYINVQEFRSLVDELTGEHLRADVRRAFRLIDTNGDGLIDFGEFARWWAAREGRA